MRGFLSYIIPCFADRLGNLEIIEPSEEIRLQMINCLIDIVESAGSVFSPFAEDAVRILSRTLLDNYPEVKKVLYII